MTSPVGVGHSSAATAVADALDRIEADRRGGIWIEVVPRSVALEAAAEVDRRVAAGAPMPLAGSTLAVKGNIDVAGFATTAGCPSFGIEATRSAPAVTALEAAGAVVVGITNLDQFATGLVGTRSPYGICPNAHWPQLISGGSSSGSAVAVAAGLVDLALGTDTAGSGRVPAAANGIVGLKPTRGRCPAEGVVPACRSLDCVSFFARTIEAAAVAARIAAASPVQPDDAWRRAAPAGDRETRRAHRIGLPLPSSLDFDGDPGGPLRFQSALTAVVGRLVEAWPDAEFVDVDLSPFLEVGRLLYGGAFVAERYEAVGDFVAAASPDIDPVVGAVISAAGRVAGWEVFRDLTVLQRLRRSSDATWADIDALVVPSVPRIPTTAEALAEPAAVNTMLGTYTNFVNLLDLTAVTIPVGEPSSAAPPTSVTLIGPAWSDELLVTLASAGGSE